MWRKIRRVVTAILVVLLLIILVYAVYATYDAYTQVVIEQQQQHLLVIARAVAQNVNLFLSEQLRDVDILIKTPGFIDAFGTYYESGDDSGLKEYVLSYMLSQQKGLSRIYLLDADGSEIFRYNQIPFLDPFEESVLDLHALCMRNQTGLGDVFRIGEKNFGLTMVNCVYKGDGTIGYVVGIVDMESLYNQLVAPLDARDSDYIMVKDAGGVAVMHQDIEMLGLNYWTDIGDLSADARYGQLQDMLTRQYNYEEGTAIYKLYPNGVETVEITSFTRMNLGGKSWFVSAAMPFAQAIEPINENLGQFGFLVLVILVGVLVSAIAIHYLQKNRQRLQMQARYLQEINYTLEELHDSREQVRHYQKLQTIGALVGGIAHEFNNLLTPILGYSEFIKGSMDKTDEFYEDIDEIYKAGGRAKEIVQQLLSFSRRESDEDAYTSVSLDAIVRDVVKMVGRVLPSSISMEHELRELGANVYGNATQIHQVIFNLCTNAYQSMEQQGGTLRISNYIIEHNQLPERYRNSSESERYGMIMVSDTGCGMEKEVLEHIFDPFFTTKEKGEGTGLGLSVAQAIIKNHGGYIAVDSVLGEGSRFCVYLPLTSTPVSQETLPETSVQKEAGKLRIVLVDDEPQVVQYLKKRLWKIGRSVDSFTNPEEALTEFQKRPDIWDIAIVDYTMPKMLGTEAARRIKKIRPDIPIIMITGFVEKEAIQMRQTGIISEILIKPIDFQELQQKIYHYTHARRGEAE